ncbi:MAG: hypothetical protein AAF738_09925 [Bacteroidota bacterium]
MSINTANYELYALDYLEGNLSGAELQAMERFLVAHPNIAAELDDLRSFTKVSPDESIVFEQKQQLLKTKQSAFTLVWWSSTVRKRLAAAAVALLLLSSGYFWGFQNGLQTQHVQIAFVSPKKMDRQSVKSFTDNTKATKVQDTRITQVDVYDTNNIASIQRNKLTSNWSKARSDKSKMPVKRSADSEITTIAQPIAEQNEMQTKGQLERIETTNATTDKISVVQSLPVAHPVMVKRKQPKLKVTILPSNTASIAAIQRNRKKRPVAKFLKGLTERLPMNGLTAQNFIPTYYSTRINRQ